MQSKGMITMSKVELIAYTPNPENVVARAARLCYASEGGDDNKFLRKLRAIGHESPFEHVSFTFQIEGISRACSHQLVRHRIASYSQKSQRYVNENGFDFITPPAVKAIPEAKSEFDRIIAEITSGYEKVADLLTMYHIKQLVSEGNDEKTTASKARKMANEDARFLLPNACETKIIVTMNARSLFNFFRLRCCNRAQWEIREVANEMLRQCKEVAPTIFEKCGPACISEGKCSEGSMSCKNEPENKK